MEALTFIFVVVVLYFVLSLLVEIVYRFDIFKPLQDLFNKLSNYFF